MDDLLLISIKTKYANQIFNGTKKYEFRRKSIGEKNINKKIFVYSSEEEKAIVGYIKVENILEVDLNYILYKTNYVNNQDIIDYFKDCEKCYALKISEAVKFKEPLYLSDIKDKEKKFVVPQFYRYIKENEYIYDELKKGKSL